MLFELLEDDFGVCPDVESESGFDFHIINEETSDTSLSRG